MTQSFHRTCNIYSLYNINTISRTRRAVHTLHKLTKVEASWANLHSHVEYLSIRESFHWNNFLDRDEKGEKKEEKKKHTCHVRNILHDGRWLMRTRNSFEWNKNYPFTNISESGKESRRREETREAARRDRNEESGWSRLSVSAREIKKLCFQHQFTPTFSRRARARGRLS